MSNDELYLNEDFSTRSKLRDIGRWYVTSYVKSIAKRLSGNALVLDAGAGECVYKKYFKHCNYKAVDLGIGSNSWNYSNLDYLAPLHNLPLENETFDAIICTQVLEHLEWPRESVSEFYRVLKTDGKLFITAPMAHGEHQVPYDFYRYTSYGLKSILMNAGFKEDSIIVGSFGGAYTRIAYEIPQLLGTLFADDNNDKKKKKGILLALLRISLTPLARVVQIILIHLDKYDKRKIYPFGWYAEAKK